MTECPVCGQRFNAAPTGQDYRYRRWKHSKSQRHQKALREQKERAADTQYARHGNGLI